jgi:AraC family transcriptional regulator
MAEANGLAEILSVIEASLTEPQLRGGDLARRAFLSRFHFDRLVRAALDEPPGAFRRRVLLERAAYRLRTSSRAVIDVASEAGYDSPDAFGRAFLRSYGVSPGAFRRSPERDYRLTTPNGIHFHPPGGLRLPSSERSTTMDVLTRMYEHHVWLSGQIIERMEEVDPLVLDAPIMISVEGIDEHPTLRLLADRLVRQLEMWVTAVAGGTEIPAGGREVSELRNRMATAEPRFRESVVDPIAAGHADITFVDATCSPPQTFSLGGVLAHVLTFSAARRTLAIGALESAGISDLGAGDPMDFVGGSGDDASTIRRNFTDS